MIVDLSDEAAEYGRVALRAFDAAGGDELLRRAEQQPEGRESLVAPVLAELGAGDLDPRRSADELEAAAALCRSAGWWGIADPVAERLCRPAGGDADALVVVDDAAPAAVAAHLPGLRWIAVTLDGRHHPATARPPRSGPRTSAFVTELDLAPLDGGTRLADPADVALGLVLPCWTLLGMLDRAVELTRTYVLDRQQFGQPLASFQGVQFQLTDAEVERAGVEELAKYALWSISVSRRLTPTRGGGRGSGWSIEAGRDDAVADALALRLAAIEAADVVFRVAHQLHGAIGFCDETQLSWLSRYSQPLRRLPLGLSATRDGLTRRIGRQGLTDPFCARDISLQEDLPCTEPVGGGGS